MPRYLSAPYFEKRQFIRAGLRDGAFGVEFSPRIDPFLVEGLAHMNAPFPDFKTDPMPISHIKTMMNALFHAQQAAAIIDRHFYSQSLSMDAVTALELLASTLTDPVGTIAISLVLTLQTPVELIDHLYSALYLFTHVDVDLPSLFCFELETLAGVFQALHKTTLSASSDKSVQKYLQAARHAGVFTGDAVERLGHLDYTFIAKITLALPDYLSAMTRYIRDYSSHPQPVILGGDDLVNSTFYAQSLGRVFSFFADITNELAHFNHAKEDLIKEKLRALRCVVIPNCLSWVDRLEVDLLLQPGQLTHRVMNQCREIYTQLEYNLEMLFNHIERDILDFDECEFMATRMAPTYQRWASDALGLEQCIIEQRAMDTFFQILKAHPGLRLCELEPNIKQPLRAAFRVMQPRLAVIDIQLCNRMVKALNDEPRASTVQDRAYNALHNISGGFLRYVADYPDRIDAIMSVQPVLNADVQQRRNTHRFNQRLNEDLLDFTYERAAPDPLQRGILIKSACLQAKSARRAAMVTPLIDDRAPLLPDVAGEARATMVVKAPIYRRMMADIRQQFSAHLQLFSPRIQGYFPHASARVPFPEINPSYFSLQIDASLMPSLLKQPKQLHGLQQLANAMHHMEHVCTQLENLDDKSFKLKYIQMMVDIGCHAQHAHLALQQCMKDAYFSRLMTDLTLSFEPIFNEFVHIRRDYLPAHGWEFNVICVSADFNFSQHLLRNDKPSLIKRGGDYYVYGRAFVGEWSFTKLNYEVMANSGIHFDLNVARTLPYDLNLDAVYRHIMVNMGHIEIRHDTIFSVANLLTLLPQHVERLAHLNHDEVADAHHIAMGISRDVARIIKSSNQYVPLFLEIMNVCGLFLILKEKALIASRAAHDAVRHHLESINDELFTPILLAVDRWEEKLCVQPGLLSCFIAQILDTYYQGLLTSLALPAKQHLHLATRTYSIERRMLEVQLRQTRIAFERTECLTTRVNLECFARALSSAKNSNYTGINLFDYLDEAKNENLNELHAILIILNGASPRCREAYLQHCNGDELLLNHLLAQHEYVSIDDVPWNHLKRLIELRDADLEGQAASLAIERDLAHDMELYLNELCAAKQVQNQTFVHHYMAIAVQRMLLPHLGVSYAYDEALSAHMRHATSEIAARVDGVDDLEQSLERIVKEKVHIFEIEQGRDYRQLYAIQEAITRLKIYLATQEAALDLAEDHVSYEFENQATLSAKRARIDELEAWLSEPHLSLQDKLAHVHASVQSPDFKETMLRYHHYDAYTYRWLAQCLASLFECLHLYQPECTSAYKILIRSSASGVSFFAAPPADNAAQEPNEGVQRLIPAPG